MKKIARKIVKHLKGDIKGYNKERKYLKKEAQEDSKLIKEIKRSKKSKKGN